MAVKTEEQERPRSPSSYLWAMLLARIDEVFPLACPRCGEPMRIIAFITDGLSIKRILDYLGEPASAPPISPARGPPRWEDFDPPEGADPVLSAPPPEYEFDQRVRW